MGLPVQLTDLGRAGLSSHGDVAVTAAHNLDG